VYRCESKAHPRGIREASLRSQESGSLGRQVGTRKATEEMNWAVRQVLERLKRFLVFDGD